MVRFGPRSAKSRPRASHQESASGPEGSSRGGAEDPLCGVSAPCAVRRLSWNWTSVLPGTKGGPQWASAHLPGTSCFQ